MSGGVLFLQGRTHRAGAQTCLARLLKHEQVRAWNPVVLCSKPGWLIEECARLSVETLIESFQRSRSLTARLWGTRSFSRRVAAMLRSREFNPGIVHANDHQEALLALSLARRIGAKAAIVLRSPGTRREDYFKYRCNEFDYISAIGDELTARIQAWDPRRKIECVYDGIFEDEFMPAKGIAPPLSKILVIGSPLAWKGWADLTEAVFRLEQEKSLPRLQFDFTGDEPSASENDLKIGRLVSRCNFLGRVEAFRELIRSYDLVINPSRMETFGMAAVEVLAAGVPLLSSRSGVMEEVQTDAGMLFEPRNPESLAQALRAVLARWNKACDFGIVSAQRNIRQKFMIDHAAADLDAAYRALLNS
ncbi:MAG: glycosyltransferase family 4 protein [Xanthobacteraceae bacterium]|nr:glycosyltransferase family 4 protein [Xanthobacteraceae bacterium]